MRELENCIRLHVNLADGDVIRIPPLHAAREAAPCFEGGFAGRRGAFERRLIFEALESNQGNIRRAASFLGIPLSTMYSKIKKYDILPGRQKQLELPPDLPERDREIGQMVARLAPESRESLYRFLKSLA